MYPTVPVSESDKIILQVADLERHEAIHPLRAFRLGQDWLLVEVEENRWRLAKRWPEIRSPFYSAVRWEFSHGHTESDEDFALVWARNEGPRVEGIWIARRLQELRLSTARAAASVAA